MLKKFFSYRLSLFKQIYLLFGFSLLWIGGMAYYANTMVLKHNQENIVQQTNLLAHQILNEFVVGNTPKMVSLARSSGFNPSLSLPKGAVTLLHTKVGLGDIQIFRFHDRYGFYLEYLDDVFCATKKFEQDFLDRHLINFIILLGFLIVLIIFGLLLAILHPLKMLRNSLEEFGSGNYQIRIQASNQPEQALLANTFNQMAQKISRFMNMRELILRNIGHELKTPIAKARLSLELMEENPQKAMLLRCIKSLNNLSNKILTLERVQSEEILKNSNSKDSLLRFERFSVSHLILTSLEDVLQNPEEIVIEIQEEFEINGDLDLLSICLKNLIENAFKYKTKGMVSIIATNQNGTFALCVKNEGEKLEKDISYYLEPFLREEKHKLIQGYGLGLSIVKEVLNLHGFMLKYSYSQECNHFCIIFSRQD